jgi:hypothetical protein
LGVVGVFVRLLDFGVNQYPKSSLGSWPPYPHFEPFKTSVCIYLDTKYPILPDPDGHQTQNKFRYHHLQMEMSLPSVLIEFPKFTGTKSSVVVYLCFK